MYVISQVLQRVKVKHPGCKTKLVMCEYALKNVCIYYTLLKTGYPKRARMISKMARILIFCFHPYKIESAN